MGKKWTENSQEEGSRQPQKVLWLLSDQFSYYRF